MKLFHTLSRFLIAVGVAWLAMASPAWAQTSLTTTTLSNALTDTAGTSVVVASTTDITAPGTGATLTMIYIDQELMAVRAVPVAGTLTVARGAGGTRAAKHAVGAFVYAGNPNAFTTVDPSGKCTAADERFMPVINTRTGTVWNCALTTATGTAAVTAQSLWQGWNPVNYMPSGPRTVVGGVQTAAALVSPNTAIGLNYTILPTDYLVVLATSGTTPGSLATAIKSFTLPNTLGLQGKHLIIKDESGAISATTQIILIGTIDGTASTVATVVALKTPYGAVGLYAGSNGWFTLW